MRFQASRELQRDYTRHDSEEHSMVPPHNLKGVYIEGLRLLNL